MCNRVVGMAALRMVDVEPTANSNLIEVSDEMQWAAVDLL
jgi:hypothetical protein